MDKNLSTVIKGRIMTKVLRSGYDLSMSVKVLLPTGSTDMQVTWMTIKKRENDNESPKICSRSLDFADLLIVRKLSERDKKISVLKDDDGTNGSGIAFAGQNTIRKKGFSLIVSPTFVDMAISTSSAIPGKTTTPKSTTSVKRSFLPTAKSMTTTAP